MNDVAYNQYMIVRRCTQVLTLTEVASRLGVSVETVRRLIKSGALKAAKVGGQFRVREEDLNDYIRRAYQ